jgi:hypothetical protein
MTTQQEQGITYCHGVFIVEFIFADLHYVIFSDTGELHNSQEKRPDRPRLEMFNSRGK